MRQIIACVLSLWSLHIGSQPVSAQTPAQQLLQSLTESHEGTLRTYLMAVLSYEEELTKYWKSVADKRSYRESKRRGGEAIVLDDHVLEHPPAYLGPQLSNELVRVHEQLQPPHPAVRIPLVSDFVQHAKTMYGFRPVRGGEDDFKRAYAREAVDLGLSKDQIVGVYAFETGGSGTHDTQAGIDPKASSATATSTGLGYAQLLSANSLGVLVVQGDRFGRRLQDLAKNKSFSARRVTQLNAKAALVVEMTKIARQVPNQWREHQKFSWAPLALGIHALNLDIDVGPWLQVVKLKWLQDAATNAGVGMLSPAQLELMNLAGPGNGLQMISAAGADAPTSNFFERNGYERNPIVHNRTAAQLLQEIQWRIGRDGQEPGAVRFARIFDEVLQAQPRSLRD